MSECEFCSKIFSFHKSLKRHYLVCREKMIYEIEQIKIENNQLLDEKTQLAQQLDQLEQQCQSEKKQYEQQIQIKDNEIQALKEQLSEFKAQLFEIAKQPKQVTNNNTNTNTQTTNNRILNITNNLVPMDLTDEQIREILKNKYTREIFLGGPDSITEMTVSQLLTDQETGKFRIVCTDTSRNVFYYQDCDENLVKDIGMEVVHKKIQKPLVEATSSHFTKIDNEKSMDDDELCILLTENISFIDHELPNKLKRKLQLPVNAQE
jgi:hypothetical protein